MSLLDKLGNVPKFWDARKFCCSQPKFQRKGPKHRVICPKDANGMTNNEDLCLHFCLDLSVPKLRIITVVFA